MTGGLTLVALAVVVALLGQVGWRSAGSWANQAWEDPDEAERKRVTLRRGALACWVVAGALAAAGVTAAIAALL